MSYYQQPGDESIQVIAINNMPYQLNLHNIPLKVATSIKVQFEFKLSSTSFHNPLDSLDSPQAKASSPTRTWVFHL